MLVVAIAGAEGRLGLIARGYPDLVVPAAEVEFDGALEGGEGFLEQWEWVAVLGGRVVESAVVHISQRRMDTFPFFTNRTGAP